MQVVQLVHGNQEHAGLPHALSQVGGGCPSQGTLPSSCRGWARQHALAATLLYNIRD